MAVEVRVRVRALPVRARVGLVLDQEAEFLVGERVRNLGSVSMSSLSQLVVTYRILDPVITN